MAFRIMPFPVKGPHLGSVLALENQLLSALFVIGGSQFPASGLL
jgi:hypothetical protein